MKNKVYTFIAICCFLTSVLMVSMLIVAGTNGEITYDSVTVTSDDSNVKLLKFYTEEEYVNSLSDVYSSEEYKEYEVVDISYNGCDWMLTLRKMEK